DDAARGLRCGTGGPAAGRAGTRRGRLRPGHARRHRPADPAGRPPGRGVHRGALPGHPVADPAGAGRPDRERDPAARRGTGPGGDPAADAGRHRRAERTVDGQRPARRDGTGRGAGPGGTGSAGTGSAGAGQRRSGGGARGDWQRHPHRTAAPGLCAGGTGPEHRVRVDRPGRARLVEYPGARRGPGTRPDDRGGLAAARCAGRSRRAAGRPAMTAVLSPAVPFTVPPFAAGAEAAVQRVLRSGWVTTGPECAAFEAELSKYLGTEAGGQPHLVTVASCTQALELSLRALRLDPGAPVLTPSLTFCGAVGAIVHAGYRPVPVDVDEATLTPSPETGAARA